MPKNVATTCELARTVRQNAEQTGCIEVNDGCTVIKACKPRCANHYSPNLGIKTPASSYRLSWGKAKTRTERCPRGTSVRVNVSPCSKKRVFLLRRRSFSHHTTYTSKFFSVHHCVVKLQSTIHESFSPAGRQVEKSRNKDTVAHGTSLSRVFLACAVESSPGVRNAIAS